MKLSIIIPAFNEEKNIAKCLQELRQVLRDRYDLPYETPCLRLFGCALSEVIFG